MAHQAHGFFLARSSTFLRFLVSVFSFLAFGTAFAAPVNFDIPAQPALTAVKAFMKQSDAQVSYLQDDLKDVRTNPVNGKMEPADALSKLVDGTGLEITKTSDNSFALKKSALKKDTGSVRGSLTGEGGKGLPNVLIAIRETAQSTETDRYGVFAFPNVAAGTYVLVASAPGYQTMHITDIQVKAGRDLTIGKEEMHKATEGPLAFEPFVVRGETVEQLEKFEVLGERAKPFTTANVDIPRTIDDVQPYYIFDSKTIDQSGATNVEDFLKNRLTMNTQFATNAQLGNSSSLGNASIINLRGLGADHTLILVNGRRMASIGVATDSVLSSFQPDINGIPLSAIDHIEVLPSSASGIYGGNALGGVVNVVLKKDYSGFELRATYDNTWGSDAPNRTISLTYGGAFEGGQTHVLITSQYSDSVPLVAGDRYNIADRGYATIARNRPDYFVRSFHFPLGSTTNIIAFPTASTLTLKGTDQSLNSNIATLPAGYSATSSPSTILAGTWNLEHPPTNQLTGRDNSLAAIPRTKAIMASFRRQMTEKVELFFDTSYTVNHSFFDQNVFGNLFYVPTDAPTNPFNQDVFVTLPQATSTPTVTESSNTVVTFGALVNLPRGWRGELDYSWSGNRFESTSPRDSGASTPFFSGALNPFVDTLRYPIDLQPYLGHEKSVGRTTLNDLALRVAGPLWTLPWGAPTAALSLEHVKQGTPGSSDNIIYPQGTDSFPYSQLTNYFGQSQVDNSGYLELKIPIITSKNSMSLLQGLELQFSGRLDNYTVGNGTTAATYYPNSDTPTVPNYSSLTVNGAPYHSKVRYASKNGTFGLQWKPVQSLMVRASYATAFLPPTPSDLLQNPVLDPNPTTIVDPTTNAAYDVQTRSGGNPNLKPQDSKSWNVGLVWEPSVPALKGLRIDVEYYKILQFNKIGSLSAQQILNDPAFSSRVTRDPATHLVTLIDTSSVNLFKLETRGFDASIDYRKDTPWGGLELYVVGTVLQYEKRQNDITSPLLDYVGFPNSGGEGKYKANATFTWERKQWRAGWTTRYFGSYYAYATTPEDPAWGGYPVLTGDFSTAYYQQVNGGSARVPAQIYHDIFVSYNFGKTGHEGGTSGVRRITNSITDGLSVQLGIKNVFNTFPPFDFWNAYYASPYGDIRLRDYWISIRKSF